MEFDLAGQLSKLVTTIDAHPWSSLAGGLFIILIAAMRKDGVITKFLGYREQKARLETTKEIRRMEIMEMIRERGQLMLPGVVREEDQDSQ